MGCFNVNCGLTGLPIQEKESIVVVTYKNLDPIFFPVLDSNNNVVEGRVREVDQTPTIDDILERNGLSKIEAVRYGTYNDYGWIEEDKKNSDDRPEFRSFYFHRWAWDWCLSFKNLVNFVKERHQEWIEKCLISKRRIEKMPHESAFFLFEDISGMSYEFFNQNYMNDEFWKPLLELKTVLLVCQQMRKDPISTNNFAGSQIVNETLILYRRLIPKMQKYIDDIEKKYNEDYLDSWDDGSDENIFWYAK